MNYLTKPYDSRLAISESNYALIKETLLAGLDAMPHAQGLYKHMHKSGLITCNNIATRYVFDMFWYSCRLTGFDGRKLNIRDKPLETVLRRILLNNIHIS